MNRSKNSSYGKRRIKKLPAVAASAAALGILTVSAGAAINWDIGSLFSNYTTIRQQSASDKMESTRWYPEREKYGKDGSLLYVQTENYNDISDKIVHSVDRTFEYDEMSINVSGYVYDGAHLEIYYDVDYSSETPELDYETGVWLECITRPADGDNTRGDYSYAKEGKRRMCMLRMNYILPEDVSEGQILMIPSLPSIPVDKYDDAANVYSENIVLIDKPDISDYTYTKKLNCTFTATDGRTGTVEEIMISPISVNITSKVEGKVSLGTYPLFIEYLNGETVDLSSWTATHGGSFGYGYGDGMFLNKLYADTNGNILDVTQIKCVKLFDAEINING